jgi:hypothetical protein
MEVVDEEVVNTGVPITGIKEASVVTEEMFEYGELNRVVSLPRVEIDIPYVVEGNTPVIGVPLT